ncbi:hypothetical protein KEM54_000543 [Ascosphaera aggregata]|nr:hypothetical protein KEM54_000543 [Ascosphaera aggregata]
MGIVNGPMLGAHGAIIRQADRILMFSTLLDIIAPLTPTCAAKLIPNVPRVISGKILEPCAPLVVSKATKNKEDVSSELDGPTPRFENQRKETKRERLPIHYNCFKRIIDINDPRFANRLEIKDNNPDLQALVERDYGGLDVRCCRTAQLHAAADLQASNVGG